MGAIVYFHKLKLANMGSLQYGQTMVIFLKTKQNRNDYLEPHVATQVGPEQHRVKQIPNNLSTVELLQPLPQPRIIVFYVSTCPRDGAKKCPQVKPHLNEQPLREKGQ